MKGAVCLAGLCSSSSLPHLNRVPWFAWNDIKKVRERRLGSRSQGRESRFKKLWHIPNKMRNGPCLQRIYTYLRRQCFSVSVCKHPLTPCPMKAKLTILHCNTMHTFNKNLVNKCNICLLLGLKLLSTSKVSKPGFTTQSELSDG